MIYDQFANFRKNTLKMDYGSVVNMEIKRSIYRKLLAWKQEKTGRVLELQGARQVGKTYILKKFAKENFEKSCYINMAEESGKDFLACMEEASRWKPGINGRTQ